MKKWLKELDVEEEVVGQVHSSALSQVGRFFVLVIWILFPFFFFFPLLRFGLFGILFFLAITFSGIFFFWKRLRVWRGTVFFITDSRVIDINQEGFSRYTAVEVDYNDIKAVTVKKKGIFARIFDLGSVRVKTKKSVSYDLEINGVRNPQRVADLIVEVQYITNRPEGEKLHGKKRIKT